MKNDAAELCIEPCAGETYLWDGETYAVYRYDEYPESSVLAGQPRRTFVDQSTDLEQLKRDHPNATVTEASGYVPVNIPDSPPPWFDPENAGETWHENDAY